MCMEMKKLKTLLLGSAAGLLVMTGAQAADLPVKARPVEYVRVCSLYGAGFYYIPGTDTCIRIGGELRAEYGFGDGNAGFTLGYFERDGIAQGTRDANEYHFRARAYTNFDARQQTAYGTLRSYIRIRYQAGTTAGLASNSATAVNLEFALIQWAGFSFGRSGTSYMHDPFSYAFKYNDIGAPGVTDITAGRNVLAYTHQFGNGFSGTIALEDSKDGNSKLPIYNANNALSLIGLASGTDTSGGTTFPDIVGQLRLDQAWGGWFLGGVLHNNHVAYSCGASGAACTENLPAANPPSDKIGFALNTSFKFNVPTAAGDAIYLGGGYAKGAVGYVIAPNAQGTAFGHYGDTSVPGAYGSVAFGHIFNSVYNVNAAGVVTADQQLTSAYGAYLAFEHNWNPEWRTSIFGGGSYLDYNATANALLCSKVAPGAVGGPGTLVFAPGQACDMDMLTWSAGSRTMWSPIKDLAMGLEVIYSRIESQNEGALFLQNHVNNFLPAATYEVKDQNIWSGRLSVRRYF